MNTFLGDYAEGEALAVRLSLFNPLWKLEIDEWCIGGT
jgi:hypothetical protein